MRTDRGNGAAKIVAAEPRCAMVIMKGLRLSYWDGCQKCGDHSPNTTGLVPHRERARVDRARVILDLHINVERVEHQRAVAERDDRLVSPINRAAPPKTTEAIQIARLGVDKTAGVHMAGAVDAGSPPT